MTFSSIASAENIVKLNSQGRNQCAGSDSARAMSPTWLHIY